MINDLLFSVLPREGKVPIAHEKQKVYKIDKQAKLRPLSDEEKELNVEEREARQQQQSKEQKQQQKEASTESAPGDEQTTKDDSEQKGPKHLDIYV